MKEREMWIASRYADALFNSDFGGLDKEQRKLARRWGQKHFVIEIRSSFKEEEMRVDPISGCADWCCKCLIREIR